MGDVGIDESRVIEATGNGWEHWFAIIDQYVPEQTMDAHPQRASALGAAGVPGWWAQMITVEYERRRGIRVVGQSSKGDFQVSCSKTVLWSLAECYERIATTPFLGATDWTEGTAWEAEGGRVEVRRADPDAGVLRWFWSDEDGRSTVTVDVWPKEPDAPKRTITFAHSGLASEEARERYRAKWKQALAQITA